MVGKQRLLGCMQILQVKILFPLWESLAFSSRSGFKKLISLGTCTAHNTDPLGSPNEYEETGELTLGWLWFLETRAHRWEWQISLTGGVERYLLALRGPLGGPRTVIDGSPLHDVWLAGVGLGRSHQDTGSAKGMQKTTRWASEQGARELRRGPHAHWG